MLPRNVLPVFLALFPRLVHLSYDVADKNQQEMAPWDYSMLAAPSVTDLVYLRWPDLVDLASVTDLLPRCCPRLGSLVVSCPADFQQHDISRLMESTLACPDMQVIRFQAGSLPANDPQDEPQPNVSGLRRLVVCQQAFVNLAVMSRILRAHEQTLVEFKCDETGHFDFIDVHHAPAVSLHMPALTRVQLSSSIPNVIRPFSAFLANAPGLIELVLNRMTIDDEIMTAIARLPRLQHLTFNKCRGDTDLLSLLVRESIDKGADCTLTSLCVRDASANMMWDEDVFIDMALIMTLHHIEVSAAVSDRRTLSSFAIRSFTENATRSGLANHLETLVLPVPKRNPNIRHLLSSSCQPLTSLKLIST
ncbi:hypothetical protein BCR43DRAFT_22553 [Syncephalastrum racemosum]|uniref:F-box domain-containing protein n=1 Tax=Syncephalastrum racemosum TaxID=13706 RepID=A0A1X2HT83_SYNRA|nr:hypothetical protein BCR43DRAFT_22553 [Syncephalastrum racemosum]